MNVFARNLLKMAVVVGVATVTAAAVYYLYRAYGEEAVEAGDAAVALGISAAVVACLWLFAERDHAPR